jgi:uncharacterized protein
MLFGAGDRPILGLYSQAAEPTKRRGVVVCHALGQEHLQSYRACRILATKLADRGHEVLRFDYFGTGDSGGEARDLNLTGAVADTVAAVVELRDTAVVRGVTLVGLRAGALVAARAAAAAAVDRLVLWDPVCEGSKYVAQAIATGGSRGPNGHRESKGFVFTEALEGELVSASLSRTDSFPPQVLIVSCEGSADLQRLESHIRARGCAVEASVIPSPPTWLEVGELGVSPLPVEALTRIAEW